MDLSELEYPSAWTPSRQHIAQFWQHERDNPRKNIWPDGPIRVIAFDPGGTTGWSVMETTLEALNDQTQSVHSIVTGWWHGQIISNDEEIDNYEQVAVHAMEELVIAASIGCSDHAVVMESYQIRSKRTDAETISPIRFIAAFEHLVWENHRYLQLQTPSEKSTASDDRLETWGFYAADGLQHARDADRHALIFLRKLRAKKSLQRKHFPMLQL